jgi:hypothetical protein
MGKKNRIKTKKISKADILQASQKHASGDLASLTPTHETVSSSNSGTSVAVNSSLHKYGGIFDHVKTDMSFFLVMIVLFAVILAVIYYFNEQNQIILQAGDWLYKFLGLN